MRKLIDIKQDNLIECDNQKCDYVIVNQTKNPNEDIKKYIDKPCPKCNENLLTEKDYLDYKKFLRIINWTNKYFSWLAFFIPKKYETETKSKVTFHNGINIQKEK